MDSIFLIVVGSAFLTIVLIGIGSSLDTQRQRTARRELARERRLFHEQRAGQIPTATGRWDHDDEADHDYPER